MARYIDADALMKELGITNTDCKKCQFGCGAFCTKDADFVDACDAICEAPTADVRENVHGKWEYSFAGNWKCSVCGDEPYYDSRKGLNYCPNCGARMESE